MRLAIKKFIYWAVESQGSTRSLGIIRIGLGLLIWSRFSKELLFYKNLSPEGIFLSANFFLASTLMVLGLFSRIATLWMSLVLGAMIYFFGFLGGTEPWTHHHTHLLFYATFFCSLGPNDRSFSLDRMRALKRAEKYQCVAPEEMGNLMALRLMALQVSALYFWTALDKTHWGYLSGDHLERVIMWFYYGSDYPRWNGFHLFMILSSWASLSLEYLLAFGLWFKKFRKVIIPLGLMFHALIYVSLPVRSFSLTMMLLYLAFLDPAVVKQWTNRMLK